MWYTLSEKPEGRAAERPQGPRGAEKSHGSEPIGGGQSQ